MRKTSINSNIAMVCCTLLIGSIITYTGFGPNATNIFAASETKTIDYQHGDITENPYWDDTTKNPVSTTNQNTSETSSNQNTSVNPSETSSEQSSSETSTHQNTSEDSTTTEATTQKPTETTTQKPAETTTKLKLSQGKVLKLTNIKSRKVKVSLKKISKAKGYEIRYSQTKSFKKYKAVTTKKTSYTIKKLTKKKRCYVKVRAYGTYGKSTVYSKWSKIKSVKVTK